MSTKLIAIGDIHGCCSTIKALIEKLEPYKDHKLIFIGDYIDRGPCSKDVVDYMIELRDQSDWDCVFLRGNHEQMLLDAVESNQVRGWMINGGETTLRSYGITDNFKDLPDDHLEFYRSTKFYYETSDYFFVHAGAPSHQPLKKSIEDPEAYHDFLWSRDHIDYFENPWEKTVIFGHTPRPQPIRRSKMIGIDTGCVYSSIGFGKLTAIILPDETFVQQASIDNNE